MPAFAIITVDTRDEPAMISQPNDWMRPVIRFGAISYGQLEIAGATREELEIICAMMNAIGQRVHDETAQAAE